MSDRALAPFVKRQMGAFGFEVLAALTEARPDLGAVASAPDAQVQWFQIRAFHPTHHREAVVARLAAELAKTIPPGARLMPLRIESRRTEAEAVLVTDAAGRSLRVTLDIFGACSFDLLSVSE